MFAVALVLGIIMLPPIGLGQQILSVMLAITLIAYLVMFLFDKARRARGTSFVLILIEFTVISLIAVGLILQQFKIFGETNVVCPTIGIVMWLRGIVVNVSMYATASSVKKSKYNLPEFLLCIIFSTLGVYLFAKPITSDLVITWCLCGFLFFCALVFGGLALLFAPIGKHKRDNDQN